MASELLENSTSNEVPTCCSKQMWVYLVISFLWVGFSLSLNWLTKEQSLIVLFLYSMAWLGLLYFRPQVQLKWLWLLLWGITRLSCFFSEPYYENDYYRYLWDGLVGLEMENPLMVSPMEVYDETPTYIMDLEERLNRQTEIDKRIEVLPEKERIELLTSINFPESPSIYGPTAQIFLALQSIPLKLLRNFVPDIEIPIKWRIQHLRFTFLLIDLLCCILILYLIKLLSLNPAWLLIFVTCPVLLKEVGNSLHIDLLSTFFILLSYCCLHHKKNILSGLLLALGAGVKMYGLVLLPLYFLWTRSPKLVLAFVSSIVALYYPFVSTGGQEIWVGTKYFSQLWSMNDFFPALIREALYRNIENTWASVEAYPIGVYEVSKVQWLARSVSLACYVFFFSFLCFKSLKKGLTSQNHLEMISWAIFGVFWFSPVQNPWYYLWGLPFFILSQRYVILFLVGVSQLYLFNFYLEPSSQLFDPFQWWVIVPHTLAGGLWCILKVKSKKRSPEVRVS